MRERPILFSGPMVTAILRGEKTQTRRVVKQFPALGHVQELRDGSWEHSPDGGFDWGVAQARCPFGQPGDRLYVKEAWRTGDGLDALAPRQIAEQCLAADFPEPWAPIRYEADDYDRDAEWLNFGKPGRLRSPIHMPRWASRLTLEVTGVRVERLQDISEGDAKAEGVEAHDDDAVTYYGPYGKGHASAIHEFARLWNSVNAKRGHPWDSNPWVWVVTFRRLEEARDA